MPPPAASLRISNSISAPVGSPVAATKVVVSGPCPGFFAVGPLASGEAATATPPGAAEGGSCVVEENAPPAEGGSWETTAVVNGGALMTLAERDGHFVIPTFALAAGVNTIDLHSTWTAPAPLGPLPPEELALPPSPGETLVGASPPAPPTAKKPPHKPKKHHRRHHRHRKHGKHKKRPPG